MSYTYDTIPWLDFATNLLTTFDLDPIYVILTEADLSEDMLKRWMLAYWCYYAAGPASYIAEQPDFYDAMRDGFAGSEQYPRGHERRHFRGQAGWEAIAFLEGFGCPEKVVDYIYTGPLDYQSVAARAMKFKLFGPWIAWKIADMGERVLCMDIDFSNADLYMYKDPVQGAALYAFGDWQAKITNAEVANVLADMAWRLKDFNAPPFLDRSLAISEYETVLCKFKAHIKGHYPINFDLDEIRHGLEKWSSVSDVAVELLRHLPDGATKYQ